MVKKSITKKYNILVKSKNKYRCFVTTDTRTILNVLVRYNPDFELVGIYSDDIDVSSEEWVDKCNLNGSEESNLVGLKRNYANKEILLKYNSFEISELLYFAYCADNRIYIVKNPFEDVKWEVADKDLKFGGIEHPMFVKDDEIGDYDIQRYYNCYQLKKLINGYEVDGFVIVDDRKKE